MDFPVTLPDFCEPGEKVVIFSYSLFTGMAIFEKRFVI